MFEVDSILVAIPRHRPSGPVQVDYRATKRSIRVWHASFGTHSVTHSSVPYLLFDESMIAIEIDTIVVKFGHPITDETRNNCDLESSSAWQLDFKEGSIWRKPRWVSPIIEAPARNGFIV